MQLENCTFIVTGGASGLGEATARAFHAAGANVVIADLNTPAGEKLADELGARAAFYRTDVAAAADARGCVELAVARFGRLQGLVNCAGIGTAAKVLGKDGPHPLDTFSRILNVNLVGTFNMIRIASEAMAKGEPDAGGEPFNMIRIASEAMAKGEPDAGGERGVIINTASVAAYDGQVGQAGYAASKGGIVSMTLPIARELARFGIRVVTIAPGLFLTPMMKGLPEEVQESLGASVPFPPRLGEPAEYAQLARQIVENAMLNGETIRLDGAIRLPPR